MAIEEVGARLSLKDRRKFSRDAQEATRDLDKLGDAADDAGDELRQAERKATRFGDRVGSSIGRGTGKAARGLGSLGKAAGGLAAKLGKGAALGLAGAVAGAAASLPFLGKALLNTAGELEATGNKARTVFGDQLPTVTKWADESAAKMGLTSSQATGLASNFADLLIPMGFARDEAAKMSTDVVGLSGALSQWSGGTRSAAEVSEILASAMLGERDALKGLGISISAAEVEATLLAKGQSKLTGAALQQAEALATQELILAKSTDAQEAYRKGGNKLLTAQNRLKSAFGTFREEAAKRFTPYAAAALEGLVKRLPAIQEFLGRAGRAVRDFLGAAKPGLVAGWNALKESLANVAERFGGLAQQEGKAKSSGETFGNLAGLALTMVGKIAEGWGALYQEVLRGLAMLGTAVGQLLGWLGDLFGALAKAPSPWRKEFRAAEEALKGAKGKADAFATTLDRLAQPRTVTVQTVYTELTAAGVRPGAAARQAARETAEAARAATPGKAVGGTVAAGKLYRINEQGVEAFVPSVTGTILTARRAQNLGAVPLDGDTSGVVADGGGRMVNEVHVYLDGRQVTAAVKSNLRTEHARR